MTSLQFAVVELSRKELYEKVWTTPMRTLAPAFGMSDVGLKKLCKRHNIPTPPISHRLSRCLQTIEGNVAYVGSFCWRRLPDD